MCNKCFTHSEDFTNGRKCEEEKSFSTNLLDSMLQLRRQWMSWMLVSHISSIGQILSKSLTERELLASKKLWRVVKHPAVLRALLTFLLCFYVGIPISFYLCSWIRRAAVYLHFLDWPLQTLSLPEYYGLNCTRHFFVETSPGVLLGVWHIPPVTTCYQMTSLSSLSLDDQPVILYLHGSAESRSAPYRRSLYNVLTRKPIQAHVITFDYRGFGDSTYISPTAKTLEEDATAMFQWLKKYVPASRIIVWGHSMGTGIAIRLSQALATDVANNPFAVILEAPFTSIADATRTFPLSIFHRRMPLFEFFCSQRTRHPDTNLNSDERVGDVTAPLLILHAADDTMVWSEQGRKLWEKAVQDRPNQLHRPVFVEFDGKYGCGHRNIHKAPNLSAEVVSFLKSVEEYNQNKQRYRE